jgi:hypothetical protein
LLVIAVGLVAAIAVGARVAWKTGRVPLAGCRIRSIDQAEYVAGNRAILGALPIYPGAKHVRTSSRGASAGDNCLPGENSGPYVSYVTSDVFTLPLSGRPLIPVRWYALDKFGNRVPTRAPVVLAYLDRKLQETGWQGGGIGSCCENAYRKGTALLFVRVTYNYRPQYEVGVIHDTTRRR